MIVYNLQEQLKELQSKNDADKTLEESAEQVIKEIEAIISDDDVDSHSIEDKLTQICWNAIINPTINVDFDDCGLKSSKLTMCCFPNENGIINDFLTNIGL